MNEANLIALAAHLRSTVVAKHFDLSIYFNDRGKQLYNSKPMGERITYCGAVACIAGHAVILAEPDKPYDSAIFLRAAKWLGLTQAQALDLFTPDGDVVDYDLVTPAIAADVLDHLRVTGEVQWPEEVGADQ